MAANDIDINSWRTVPDRVALLLPGAAKVLAAHDKAASAAYILPLVNVTWMPEANAVTLWSKKPITEKQAEVYRQTVGDYGVVRSVGAPDWNHEILIKLASSTMIPGMDKVWQYSNAALGGPTPLSNGIVASLLMGGLGYGGGALAENLFPERYVQRGKLRKSMAAMGALGGLGLAANNAYANGRAMHTNMLRGLVTSNNAIPPYLKEGAEKQSYDYGPDPTMSDDTGLYAPKIPVQQFNQMAWHDVSKQYYNPMGFHTPPQYAAATTGMLSGISAGMQSPIIRPIDVVRGFASAGVGLATANLAGRTLSALAGLTPEAQNKLQDMGLWAGMMHAIAPPLFSPR